MSTTDRRTPAWANKVREAARRLEPGIDDALVKLGRQLASALRGVGLPKLAEFLSPQTSQKPGAN